MERKVEYFTHDYRNDTAIEYVEAGTYSCLNCSFTSEDPDYGTDTLHYVSHEPKEMKRMAYEMLMEVKDFLDWRDGEIDAPRSDVQIDYGYYSNSTLIAIESALHQMAKGFNPNRWFMTIEDAGKMIGDAFLNGKCREFNFCESSQIEMADYDPATFEGEGWYGIKRIDGFFDNSPRDLIIAVGYYGGGNCTFGYVNEEYIDTLLVQEEIAKAICESTGGSTSDIIFLEMDEKESK